MPVLWRASQVKQLWAASLQRVLSRRDVRAAVPGLDHAADLPFSEPSQLPVSHPAGTGVPCTGGHRADSPQCWAGVEEYDIFGADSAAGGTAEPAPSYQLYVPGASLHRVAAGAVGKHSWTIRLSGGILFAGAAGGAGHELAMVHRGLAEAAKNVENVAEKSRKMCKMTNI